MDIKDGRQIAGKFLSADEEGAHIRRSDGRTVKIPKSMLSDVDLAHIEEQADKVKEDAEAKAAEEERKALLKGPLTYELSDGWEKWPEERRRRIVEAMDSAVSFLNEHGDFKKSVTANDSPSTPTANANYNGWINLGGSISHRVALHELAHTLGVGTHPAWQENVKDGKWTGNTHSRNCANSTGRMRCFTPTASTLAVWPQLRPRVIARGRSSVHQDGGCSAQGHGNPLRFAPIPSLLVNLAPDHANTITPTMD